MQVTRTVFRDDHEMFRHHRRAASSNANAFRARPPGTRTGVVDRETWLKAGRDGLLCITVADGVRRRRRRLRPLRRCFNEESRASGVSRPWLCGALGHHCAVHRRASAARSRSATLAAARSARGEAILAIGMTEPGTGTRPEGRCAPPPYATATNT
ncbi:hypothetical protein ACU4GD_17710 [Cupriavidus basilensis]